MRIGIDFNDVVADALALRSQLIKEKWGIELPPENCRRNYAVAEGFLSEPQFEELLTLINETEEGLKMKPIEGAIEAVREFQKTGHEIVIVSNRREAASKIARQWCQNNGLGDITFESVGRDSKKRKALGCDVFIDDDPEKLEQLWELVPSLILFGNKLNQKDRGIFMRIEGWNNIVSKIKEMGEPTREYQRELVKA